MSSDDDATQLMATFRKGGATRSGATAPKSASGTPAPRRSTPRRSPARKEPPKKRASIVVENLLSESSSGEDVSNAESPPKVRRLLQIRPKPITNKEEYIYYEPKDEVESIVKESTARGNNIAYVVKLVGGEAKEVSEAAASQQLREGVRELAAGGNRAATQRALLRPYINQLQAPSFLPLHHDLYTDY
jgi:chromodomain-helicase-DNA-binding protein 4